MKSFVFFIVSLKKLLNSQFTSHFIQTEKPTNVNFSFVIFFTFSWEEFHS